MRAIRFRGMIEPATPGRKWAFGDLIQYRHDKACIQYTDEEGYIRINRVKIDTIGQFTGLHDNAGRAIYEGDIIQFKYLDRIEELGYGTVEALVIFERGCFKVIEIGSDNKTEEKWILNEWLSEEECEIIGNIHESRIQNPESRI